MKAADIDEFLRPLRIDTSTAHRLAQELSTTFKRLAAESHNQFLPTPVTETILRPPAGDEKGRYLAIDIGGTNLRVGFIELLGRGSTATVNGHEVDTPSPVRLRRHLERSWPIQDLLKNENADHLFSWIGSCIAEVAEDGCREFHLPRDEPLPLGVTFSFPMIQHTLSEATLMAMGKGFAITTNVDLASQLSKGYETARKPGLPPVEITAIANDAVATLVSFVYQSPESASRKAAMGLICGTGSNATIPLRMSMLKPSKLPRIPNLHGQGSDDPKVAVNTEWSINGTASALRSFNLVSKWDEELDAAGEAPGFQPLEYMTAGRYLGELGRIILLDYLAGLGHHADVLPEKLQTRFGLTTTFLSHFKPLNVSVLLGWLEAEFPITATGSPFGWTEEMALVVYSIAKAIEVRAAGIIAAATVGLLACAGDIPFQQEPRHHVENGQPLKTGPSQQTNLVVGFTGGCIAHFQDYLSDCREFLQGILEAEFGTAPPVRISLHPCHDGGITGAGVLSGTSRVQSEHAREA